MTFYQDLEFGENNERLVLKKVQVKYPKAYKVEGYCKEWDIYIPEKKIGIEVKSDRRSHETGNIAIECSYGGEPSGIEATKAVEISHRKHEGGIVINVSTAEEIKKQAEITKPKQLRSKSEDAVVAEVMEEITE